MTTTLDDRLRRSPSVVLRPEPFGALAYHFDNRRLTFLKRPELVAVVGLLDGERSVRDCLVEAGVTEQHWTAYAEALDALVDADMLERPGGDDDG